jgi:hypothetical protein
MVNDEVSLVGAFVRVDFVPLTSLPAAGLVLLALADGICVACVVGRYHYAVDAAAGAGVALLFWLVN